MPKLLTRTYVPSGSCTSMTSMQPFYSGVLIGTSTGHLFLITYIRGRAKVSAPKGFVGEESPVIELSLCNSQLVVMRNSGLLQIYELQIDESNVPSFCLQLVCEHSVDESPKFRPLFLDKGAVFAVRKGVLYNLLDKKEQLSLPSNTFLGIAQLTTCSTQFVIYGDGLTLWKWTRTNKNNQLQNYLLDLHKYAAIGTEVAPCILHFFSHRGFSFCATNMGLLLYFPELQISEPPVEDGRVYPMVYPMICLTIRRLLCWNDLIVPCGGHGLELLSFKEPENAAPDISGTMCMTFEDISTCGAASDGLLWICTGGAGICLLAS
ncbi:hypothetical protein QR46_2373 [Giardia duodenalis assemblage B]|uniref:Uncharacterized protein n=1 Tax=Giardia duodenalis assemblage B TaxID=1394984 RepID=A0A132NU70_GIAIN|nr:hypothetical protein QR46_2373 [Giardia intestinalis assemblage B]